MKYKDLVPPVRRGLLHHVGGIIIIVLAFLCPRPIPAAPLTEQSAYEIAEAYQMEGVSEAVGGLVRDEIYKQLQGKIKEWTVEAFADVEAESKSRSSDGRSWMETGRALRADGRFNVEGRDYKKEEIKKRLKAEIKKNLPGIAKKVLYEKLFMGKFGDEVTEIKETVDKVISELQVSFNDRADQFVSHWYDQAMKEIDEYLKLRAGPIVLDATDIRGTLNAAIRMENVEWGFSKALSEAVGESTASGIKERMKDILAGQLPPEAIKYLNYGPEKFAEYASKIEEYLPGKKLDELKEKLLHTPLFILPNGVYCGILAASAAKHFAAAFKGMYVDPYELKRGVEVTKVMVWQAQNKEGLSVDLASFLDAIKMLSDKFGLSLDNLGQVGKAIGDVKDKMAQIEKLADKMDNLIKGNIDKVQGMLQDTVNQIKGALEDVQNTLFKPLIEGYNQADKFINEANKVVQDAIPENFYGVPADWEKFKKQAGIEGGLFGKLGDKSPWDIIHETAEKLGLIDAYEKFKKDMKKTADDINDALSGAAAAIATEAADAFGFTDPVARALGIEYVPAQNPSIENPLDPVLLHSGEFYHQVIDLIVPGRGLHYQFKRTYRSKTDFKGAMGHNWAHNYEERIIPLGNRAIYIDDGGRKYVFKFCRSGRSKAKSLHGGGSYTSPPGVFSVLYETDEEARPYVLRAPDGLKTYFGKSGLMVSKEDRFGNGITFEHDKYGRLIKAVDALGRAYRYSYHSNGQLAQVEDFSGRSVSFEYDKYSDLVAATGPFTFDFPEGKTIRYGYSTGYYEQGNLNHNLTLVMDPKGQIYIRNTYGEREADNDRVVAQQYGSEGLKMSISYQHFRPAYLMRFVGKGVDEAVDRVVVCDRRGVTHFYQHNFNGNSLGEEYVDELGRRRPKARQYYNSDGMLVKTVYPGGRVTHLFYDDGNSKRSANGNLLERREVSAIEGEGMRIMRFVYEPLFGQIKMIVNPLGGRRLWHYDYEEEGQKKDINGDGVIGGAKGVVVAMEVDSGKDSGERSIYRYRYNSYGQRTAVIDPAGVVTGIEYYPEGGYLKAVTHDAEDLGDLRAEGAASGAATIFNYDQVGNIIAVTDPEGHTTNYMVNSLNELVKETSPKPYLYTKKYAFDANDNLVQVRIDNRGGRNDKGAAEELIYKFAYDSMDNLLQKEEPVANGTFLKTNYKYDPEGRLVQTILPEGNRIEHAYDAAGRLVRITRGDGTLDKQVVRIGYDADDNPIWVKNGANAVTRYVYNGFGELHQIVDPVGNRYEAARDGMGRIRREQWWDRSNTLLAETEYKYNYQGRLAERRRHEWQGDLIKGKWLTEKWEYNSAGQAVKYADADGFAQHISYNGLGRVAGVTYPDGRRVEYGYDRRGLVVSKSEYPSGSKDEGEIAMTGFSYDELGQLVGITDPLGARNTFGYDSRGNIVEAIGSLNTETRFYYDGLGRRIGAGKKVKEGEWIGINYVWDGNGRLVSLADGNGNQTRYQYDSLDRLVLERYADGGEVSYRYDVAGNLYAIRDQNGSVIYQLFDPARRLVARRTQRSENLEGTTMQAFLYDGLNRLIYSFDDNDPQATADDNVNYYYYDSLSNLVAEIQNDRQVVRSFDSGERVNIIKHSLGSTVYRQFDQAGRLSNLFFDGHRVGRFSYDRRGRLSEFETGGGILLNQYYDLTGKLVGQRHRLDDGSEANSIGYVYDSVGRLGLKMHDGRNWEAYGYDGAGRLISTLAGDSPVDKKVSGLSSWTNRIAEALAPQAQGVSRWVLDDVGNWLEHSRGEESAYFDYDEMNRIIAMRENDPSPPGGEGRGEGAAPSPPGGEGRGEGEFSYDKNGNLISDDRFKYVYDGFNRLIAVYDFGNSPVARYTYDVHNRRMTKAQAKSQDFIRYVYDNWDVIEEYENEKPARSYIYEGEIDSPVAMVDHLDNGKKYFYHRDYSHSVIAVSDEDGNFVKNYRYQPYGLLADDDLGAHGNPRGYSGIQPYAFTSRRVDPETGLMYYRHRYYSPRMGRFITQDPLGYKTSRYEQGEAITPFHLSYHRRRQLNTYPNNFNWLVNDEGWSGGVSGVAGFNRLYRRPFELRRTGEMNLYAYAGSDPVNLTDPMGLDFLWVSGEYVPDNRGKSGRRADLTVMWIEEHEEGDYKWASIADVYHGTSGPFGKGPLPSGDYTGHSLWWRGKRNRGSGTPNSNYNSGMSIGGDGWSMHIDPEKENGRSLLRVHPDGNNPGTFGCIAIDDNGYIDLHNRLKDYLGGYWTKKKMDVYVRIRAQGEDMPASDGDLDYFMRSHAGLLERVSKPGMEREFK